MLHAIGEKPSFASKLKRLYLNDLLPEYATLSITPDLFRSAWLKLSIANCSMHVQNLHFTGALHSEGFNVPGDLKDASLLGAGKTVRKSKKTTVYIINWYNLGLDLCKYDFHTSVSLKIVAQGLSLINAVIFQTVVSPKDDV